MPGAGSAKTDAARSGSRRISLTTRSIETLGPRSFAEPALRDFVDARVEVGVVDQAAAFVVCEHRVVGVFWSSVARSLRRGRDDRGRTRPRPFDRHERRPASPASAGRASRGRSFPWRARSRRAGLARCPSLPAALSSPARSACRAPAWPAEVLLDLLRCHSASPAARVASAASVRPARRGRRGLGRRDRPAPPVRRAGTSGVGRSNGEGVGARCEPRIGLRRGAAGCRPVERAREADDSGPAARRECKGRVGRRHGAGWAAVDGDTERARRAARLGRGDGDDCCKQREHPSRVSESHGAIPLFVSRSIPQGSGGRSAWP